MATDAQQRILDGTTWREFCRALERAADARFPGFFQLANETIKIGNDNPDNIYRNANVSGRYRYRIWGTRGGAPILSFGTKGGGYESDGTMVPTGQIDADAIDVGL